MYVVVLLCKAVQYHSTLGHCSRWTLLFLHQVCGVCIYVCVHVLLATRSLEDKHWYCFNDQSVSRVSDGEERKWERERGTKMSGVYVTVDY